jgi:hypothetical protein
VIGANTGPARAVDMREMMLRAKLAPGSDTSDFSRGHLPGGLSCTPRSVHGYSCIREGMADPLSLSAFGVERVALSMFPRPGFLHVGVASLWWWIVQLQEGGIESRLPDMGNI